MQPDHTVFFLKNIRLTKVFPVLFLLFFYIFGCAHVPQQPSRIVAVGDVHGDYEDFADILQRSNLIDNGRKWIGGNAVLVQMGDIMDRGPDVREVMDLLMSLEKQARGKGGKVITLIGNHEAFNLMGYFDRQSTPLAVFDRICESFADDKSRLRRENAYQKAYQDWTSRYPRCGGETQTQWMDTHPLGLINYQKAINSSGKYGKWLRRLPAVVRLNDILFVHGGISPELDRLNYITPESVNITLKNEIDRFDLLKKDLIESGDILPFSTLEEIECVVDRMVEKEEAANPPENSDTRLDRLKTIQKLLPRTSSWMQLSSDGPLWFRGYAHWSQQEGQVLVDEIVKAWNVNHIVVGHTPTRSGRIQNRFGNRIFLIDTGMVYGRYSGTKGRPSALEIKNGIFTAIYLDGSVRLDVDNKESSTDSEKVQPPYPETREPESPM